MSYLKHLFFIIFLTLFSIDLGADVPKPWQMGLQDPATPVMESLYDFHNYLLIVVFVITIFVFALMGYVLYRFSHKRNPVPSKTSHNTMIEVVWTLVPCIILGILAVPSFKLLYYQEIMPKCDLTLKVVGYQWYWHYDYPDDEFGFDSYIKKDEELDIANGDIRLLSVDNQVVLPIKTNVRVQITAADVIHSWAVPSFGVKKDAVPGRLNEIWINIQKPGVYYGQCSELCGANHGFMPIVVKAVERNEYEEWLKDAKAKFAKNNNGKNFAVNSLRVEEG